MDKDIMLKDYKDFMYIVRCAVRNEKIADDYVIKTSLSKLLSLSCFHSIEALLYDTVKSIASSEEDKITLNEWKIAHDKAYRRYIMFTAERQAIIAELEKQGIWYLLLKGVILQEDYTKPYYRQMSDNDIIFDKDRRLDVKSIMVSRGYRAEHFNMYYDDIYYKEPFYNFEMHVRLSVSESYERYFENIQNRLIELSTYSRKMDDKDFYIYVLLHELKHYEISGVGIRSLIDLYYYLLKHVDLLDWEDINDTLTSLALDKFENQRRHIVDNLFSDDINDFYNILNDETLMYYFASGTHGTLSQFVDNKLKVIDNNHSFISFYIQKLKNSWKFSVINYPFLTKYKFIVPFFMIYKLIASLFNKRNWKELSLVLDRLKKK